MIKIRINFFSYYLLKEYKESLKYEECLYEIVNIQHKLYLYDTKTQKEIMCYNPKKWLERRNINLNLVYNNRLL